MNKNRNLLNSKRTSKSIIKSDDNKKKSKQEKLMNFDLITKKKQEEISFKNTIILSNFRNNLFGINQNLNQLVKCGIIGYSLLNPQVSAIFAGIYLHYFTYVYFKEMFIFKKPKDSFFKIKNIDKKNDFFYSSLIFLLTMAIFISPIKKKIKLRMKKPITKDLVIKDN